MEDKNRLDETVSDLSLQDILDEINADSYDADESINLDEILAEFSYAPKTREEPAVVAETEKKEEIKIYDKKEVAKSEKPIKKEEKKPQEKAEPVKVEPKPIEETAPKPIETIVRPWQDGVYGDMDVSDTIRNSQKKKKTSKFSETFDTFTRSDLFENKNKEEKLETRSVEEILIENKKVSRFLGIRAVFLFVLSLLSCYLAFAEPLNLFMPQIIAYIVNPFRYLFLTAFFEILAMLLSIDVISRGLYQIVKLRPNRDSAITFAAFATLIHVITIMAAPKWGGWLPYSCISVFSLFFAVFGKWIRARAITRVCRTVRAAKEPNVLHVETNYGETNIIKQTTTDTKTFVAHINDKDASENIWRYFSPIVIITSIVGAVVSAFATKAPQNFFWALSAISCVSAPLFTALSFAFPFSVTAKSLSSVGTALSGWYSSTNLSRQGNVVVCDSDLFPKGCVSLNGLKILGNFSLEQTVCYAASVIAETKSGLCDVFSDLLKSRYAAPVKVNNLRYHEAGGAEAEIEGNSVLVGTAGFMIRSGIRLVSGTNTKNAIFVCINKQPAGVFNINYKVNREVERALHLLVKKKVSIILAVRDFNLTPMMVEKLFGLKDGSLEYPELEQRFDMSNEEQYITSDISAVITRAGLYPFAAAVLAAKKLRKVTIRNICMTTASSFIGMFFMFYLTFMQRPELITPHTVLVYMLLWFVPMYMLSLKVKK